MGMVGRTRLPRGARRWMTFFVYFGAVSVARGSALGVTAEAFAVLVDGARPVRRIHRMMGRAKKMLAPRSG